ncbi:sugar ABC transporter ATP-binding protein [Pseudovibrio exalbescens]|uniref:sugar ABC transporter ATP-binding protein n=1 Tax=Pseudovibrio exalbescens TaxID=197461 RepID=UPI0023665DE9|nr:sugar ABC transporter ATP-binding protein [Pseudovibrio exalbescens]MDD7910570.1 sugar ABC transporter ATP-binding protein [Pseudovibrio exalbescens]
MGIQSDSIEISGIKKSFGTNTVLHDISLTVSGGEVLALMGANGAGKSTLVKILSGVYQADGGSISVNGQTSIIDTPQQARESGIVTVHQIINDGVVQDLTIAENLILDQLCDGRFPAFVNKGKLHERAAEVAKTIGLDLPLDTKVAELSQADKQLVAIARALSVKPRLLILDEPTSSLSEREALRLFDAVEQMRDQGVAIIYISHRMSDIRRLADRIAALREGRIVGLFEKPLDYDGAVHSMLGHAVGEVMHDYQSGEASRVVFRQVQLAEGSKPFDLDLKTGQIVALTGLLSSGCASVVESLFGMHEFASGTVMLDGAEWRAASPNQAIKDGVYMVQEDRGNNAIIPDFSIENNTSLPFLKSFSWLSFINRDREKARVKEVIDLTKVKYTDPTAEMSTLSGGNQQKVMVARWMLEECRVLLLNEPFQGVDISSRRQIGKLLRETAKDRVTIAVCTDVEEALEIADRIIVFNHNNLVGDHRIDQIDMPTLIKQIAAAPDADFTALSSSKTQETDIHA